VPPPTITGDSNKWTWSTRPAANASAARCGPPIPRSLPAVRLSSRTASGSKRRSIRVRSLVLQDLDWGSIWPGFLVVALAGAAMLALNVRMINRYD